MSNLDTIMLASNVPDQNKRRSVMDKPAPKDAKAKVKGKFKKAFAEKFGEKYAKKDK